MLKAWRSWRSPPGGAISANTGARSRVLSATRPAARLFAGLVVTLSGGIAAPAAEICRFTGTTDYSGHVAVTTRVTARAGAIQVDVAGTFDSSTMFWFGVHYLVEEVSNWHDGQLESVAVNSRYLIGDHIIRQQWDDFQRGTDGLQASRVQAKIGRAHV